MECQCACADHFDDGGGHEVFNVAMGYKKVGESPATCEIRYQKRCGLRKMERLEHSLGLFWS